jgi:hypothetical protein
MEGMSQVIEFKEPLSRDFSHIAKELGFRAEEGDFGSIAAIDTDDPSSVIFTRTMNAVYVESKKSSSLNPFFGRELRRFVDKLGLTDFVHDGSTSIQRGGEARAKVLSIGLAAREKTYVNTGVFTQEQYDTTQRLYADPLFYFWSSTIFAAWGRKPVK